VNDPRHLYVGGELVQQRLKIGDDAYPLSTDRDNAYSNLDIADT
jgi:hypothetical protein